MPPPNDCLLLILGLGVCMLREHGLAVEGGLGDQGCTDGGDESLLFGQSVPGNDSMV